jgi:hypothetical protein
MSVRARSLAYQARNAYASYCDVICGLSLHHIFFILHYKRHNFRKKTLNTKCVFLFSTYLSFEAFVIVRRIQQDIVINVETSSCKVPVIFVGF